ncbi:MULTISPECIES: hypothetical protein [Halocynthiibacter]|uniref:Glutamine amidotransferase domain-containing protein n=1 Tax=Halocynthiibacter halioticoli TaxID=2986804 RepID=A0AAE3IZK8_9RHOB|nr:MULTISPECIES: hypothetical protein [Halocynthiibacter]MCV6823396.1 hypothetical protein [Halocynthiibacter halioticoli]MCW4056397.1 hypothetical protein [Halocynthiibacter sp. SDUM655004]
MREQILFDPLLPVWLVGVLAAVAGVVLVIAALRGLSGWWLRGLVAAILLGAVLNPSIQRENREALSDLLLVLVDNSASQRISDRPDQTAAALAEVRAKAAALPNTEVKVVTFEEAEQDGGTPIFSALVAALAELPQSRIAGIIAITDGRAHDIPTQEALTTFALPAPFQTVLTGRKKDWDRRFSVSNAPAFGIIGEPVLLTLKVEDQGNIPAAAGDMAELIVSIDGGAPESYQVPVGEELEVPLVLNHAGMNVVQFEVPTAEGELTDRNNSAVLQINGVRDRLRVLLVSGEPHPGERTWRNLLKSDSSVDLVHFTILRPPNKQDGVPVSELSLIAFPTRELFLEKIDDFDLIIFDRYKRRGILPSVYLENVRDYALRGGAVLVAAGPDFASVDSLFYSSLSEVLPGAPTSRLIEEEFLPRVSELGQMHPVTEGLQAGETPDWGRWLRMIEVAPFGGQTILTGANDAPLLMLDRVGEGRIALLASDHAWLWHRGFDGGGPQLELLRRLAHWMMKEPELEEEGLWATAIGQEMAITRRTLEPDAAETLPPVTLTTPSGEEIALSLSQARPGRFEARYSSDELGLYRLTQGEHSAVVALGPTAPREFIETVASAEALEPLSSQNRGGSFRAEEGVPDFRFVREGRPAAGTNWAGFWQREAFLTTDITVHPLAPAWLVLLLASALTLWGWLREGRR